MLLMSIHNVGFCEELRKISIHDFESIVLSEVLFVRALAIIVIDLSPVCNITNQ